ncbi:MAG: DNA mismatch repair endonuclease MutL [Chloroflexi bacterium]|nr:DNA mismatch repair endonuclease MutL [Chloroflexota bacterium]
MSVQVLPAALAAKIAAGEVVERPASVVKELCENALDAQATAIAISIEQGGLRRIHVEDNGDGIAADDLPLTVHRYATSKISSVDDLAGIRTLGFRGEALASIAAVSHLDIRSRTAQDRVAQGLKAIGGEDVEVTATAGPVGTAVDVRHLFFNVPARLAFCKSPQAEAQRIIQCVQHLALSHPAVRFALNVNGREVIATTGSGRMADVFIAMHGHELADQLIPVDDPFVQGVLTQPTAHRGNRTGVSLFVNNRWVQQRALVYTVTDVYAELMPDGRFPLAALDLALPVEDVDVNVHPQKSDIRLKDGGSVTRRLRHVLRSELARHVAVQPMRQHFQSMDSWRSPGTQPSADQTRGAVDLFRPPDAHGGTSGNGPPDAAPATPAELRVLGQINAMYLIAEGVDGVYLIDQHSAHERVLYEAVLKRLPEAQSQQLLQPQPLTLSPTHVQWLEANVEELQRMGFALESFGAGAWLLRAVPLFLAERGHDWGQFVKTVIEQKDNPDYRGDPLERLRWVIACHSAVKAGDTLAHEQIVALLGALERCDLARTCPHGRPTMVRLSHAQLAREFGRA